MNKKFIQNFLQFPEIDICVYYNSDSRGDHKFKHSNDRSRRWKRPSQTGRSTIFSFIKSEDTRGENEITGSKTDHRLARATGILWNVNREKTENIRPCGVAGEYSGLVYVPNRYISFSKQVFVPINTNGSTKKINFFSSNQWNVNVSMWEVFSL